MRRLKGTGVVPGTAVGRAVLLVRRGRALRVPVSAANIDEEVARLDRACQRSREQIERIQQRLRSGPGADLAGVFDAHLLMLDDPLLVERARALIRDERVNAEWAVQRAFEEVAVLFDGIDDPYLRDRRGDVADVAGRVRMNLREGTRGWQDVLARGEGPFVIVADDPPPSVAAQVDWTRVTGLAIDAGSRTSHTAILARSLGIPTVVGLGNATAHVVPGMIVALDGAAGELVLEPTDEHASQLRARANPPAAVAPAVPGPAATRDGVGVSLEANVDRPEDVSAALRAGADGVGLFRSEFLLLGAGLPGLTGPESEAAQADAYRRLLDAMAPRPVTIRTFDIDPGQEAAARAPLDRADGADRHEALGLRGVRLGLAHPALLDTQLRAILRAAGEREVRVLLPFVTVASEIRAVRARLDTIARELASAGVRVRPPQLGAMIEVPAAALAADHLAAEADFLAIGTNDLIQYLLAADRTDERMLTITEGLHPALLRLLRVVPRLAARHGAALSICGELASDPVRLALLIGLGFRAFSMTPAALAAARRVVGGSRADELTRLARRASRDGLLEDIDSYVRQASLDPTRPAIAAAARG